jgi:pimeloyl-ACP methyl ester carboxylesterase
VSERFVETNGVRLWCESLGDAAAPPVVLVSGAWTTAMWWCPEFIDGLTGRGWRVIRFDNRDIGLSTHFDFSVQPYTLSDMVTDTAGLLNDLGIDRAYFVGISLGGLICQLYALEHPGQVLSLTLISTSPGPSDPRLSKPSNVTGEIAMRQATTPEQLDQRTLDLFRALAGSRFPFDEAGTRQMIANDNKRGTNREPAHILAAMSAPSWLDELGRVSVPALVIHGTEDPLFGLDHAEALVKAIPHAQLVLWEGVGHEVPRQLVPELLDSLDEHFRSH